MEIPRSPAHAGWRTVCLLRPREGDLRGRQPLSYPIISQMCPVVIVSADKVTELKSVRKDKKFCVKASKELAINGGALYIVVGKALLNP